MKNDLKRSPVKLLISLALILAGYLPVYAQTQKLYAPLLAATSGGSIGVTLVNPTMSDAQVTLTARNYSGAIIQKSGVTNPVTLTLAASSQTAQLGTEIFGNAISGQSGWIEISANSSS